MRASFCLHHRIAELGDLRNPPLSRLDLIWCRHTLIYLERSAQTSALKMIRLRLSQVASSSWKPRNPPMPQALFRAFNKKTRVHRVNASASTRGHTAYLNDRRADSMPLLPVHVPEPVRVR
jgi:hypothetical protein